MQSFIGTVVCVKTPKTAVVVFDYPYRHRKYLKIIKRTTRIMVHNEREGLKAGDRVKIIKSRPYSKKKHFIVLEVLP